MVLEGLTRVPLGRPFNLIVDTLLVTNQIYILNRLNLNLYAISPSEVCSADALVGKCTILGPPLGVVAEFYQSNHDVELVDTIYLACINTTVTIADPGVISKSSMVSPDALNTCEGPVYEVRIPDIYNSKNFRNQFYVMLRVGGAISRFHLQNYEIAHSRLARHLA